MDIDAMLKQLTQLLAFKNRVMAILPDLETLVASGKETSEDLGKVLGDLDPKDPIAGATGLGGASEPILGTDTAPADRNAPAGA